MSLQLEFIGHACFRFWEDGKPAIVMDPFDYPTCSMEDTGFQLDADAGCMTHIDTFLNSRPRDPVYVVRHHVVELPLPTSPEGRPTIVILEPAGYQATGGFPSFACA